MCDSTSKRDRFLAEAFFLVVFLMFMGTGLRSASPDVSITVTGQIEFGGTSKKDLSNAVVWLTSSTTTNGVNVFQNTRIVSPFFSFAWVYLGRFWLLLLY